MSSNTPLFASIDIKASAQQVFDAWAQADCWHLWDPDTRQAVFSSAPGLGAKGRLVPTKGRAVQMVIDAWEPGRRLKVLCPVLGSTMHFDHTVTDLPSGQVRATHTVWFTGWAAPLLRLLLSKTLERNLPTTMAFLKRYVEGGEVLTTLVLRHRSAPRARWFRTRSADSRSAVHTPESSDQN